MTPWSHHDTAEATCTLWSQYDTAESCWLVQVLICTACPTHHTETKPDTKLHPLPLRKSKWLLKHSKQCVKKYYQLCFTVQKYASLLYICSNLKHVFFVSNTSSDLKYIPSLFYAAVIKCWANSRVLNAETAALRRVKKLYSPRVLKSFMLRAVLKGFISTLLQPHNEAAASPYKTH